MRYNALDVMQEYAVSTRNPSRATCRLKRCIDLRCSYTAYLKKQVSGTSNIG